VRFCGSFCTVIAFTVTRWGGSGPPVLLPSPSRYPSACPLGTWYIEAGGPLGLWRRWADDVRGDAVAAAPQPR
jgi:hypothetical protein